MKHSAEDFGSGPSSNPDMEAQQWAEDTHLPAVLCPNIETGHESVPANETNNKQEPGTDQALRTEQISVVPTHTQPGQAFATDRLVGTIIDERYQIKARLATGGMATVYRAQDTRLDRPVALKIMHPHLAESADFVARFQREARAAARLTHPGIVAVYDQGVTDAMGYLVMELVEGPNLRSYLRKHGSLTLGRALELTEQILQALSVAHHSGLVHRDVKPENVLLPSTGPAKVADFGLARAASEVTAATTGSILGTVAYLAPEILTTTTAVDARVDIYAVGVMLYEMLVGQVPFTGETAIQVAYLHVHQGVPRAAEKISWLPAAIDDLIATLTQRDLDSRPLDASEALEVLRQARATVDEDTLAKRTDVPPYPEPVTAEPIADDDQAAVRTLTAVPLPGVAKPKATSKEKATRIGSGFTRHRGAIIGIVLAIIAVTGASVAFYFLWGPGAYRQMVDVAGRSVADASQMLRKNNIEFELKEEFSDTVASQVIIKTNPDAKGKVSKWGRATVYVSKGIEHLTVPKLVGLEKDTALQTLKNSRFSTNTVEEAFHQTVPQGQVISQTPGENESVPHNTNIKIVVSKGREPIVMPNLVGKLRDEAAATLQPLGINPQWSEDFSDTVPKGKIISQSAAADSSLFRGDGVSLVVSKGPRMVAIPNVTRKSRDEATRILQNAGFKVKVSVIFALYNTVADTIPAAGTMAEYGSTVTIRII